ncbi:MAG: ribosomal-processing cysteine protease Prp [Oscillospiraceae bacterium]|jgi:uncharacterized protein YsxB (DUF464 family)|nr:ribosomal-processing cysteine protease Prp [Oscillospiraceae bacterium]
MVIVKMLKNKGKFLGFDIKGHVGKGEIVDNIVCAAVSSAAYMAVNTITNVVNAQARIHVDSSGGMFARITSGYNQECDDILKGLEIHLFEISEENPNSILMSSEEAI